MDVWSNHACQVALSQRQHCLIWWVHSFFPGLRKMHPSATYVNQQAASCPRSAQAASVPMVLLSLDFGQGMHPTSRKGQSPSCWTFMYTEGHVQRVPGYGGEDLQNDTKSKDKGKRPNQGRIAKRITLQRTIAKDLQITKLGDDQERRPTPFPSGAKRKGASDCPARRRQ